MYFRKYSEKNITFSYNFFHVFFQHRVFSARFFPQCLILFSKLKKKFKVRPYKKHLKDGNTPIKSVFAIPFIIEFTVKCFYMCLSFHPLKIYFIAKMVSWTIF